MAVEEQAPATTAGERPEQIEVHNPATGKLVRSIPVVGPDGVAEMVARARAAQPAWEALGYEGRARVMRRAQKWLLDHQPRVVETIMTETGKTYEDAVVAEVGVVANGLGFWAKKAPEFLADEKVRSTHPFVLGRKLIIRYRPMGVVGVIGPWNYPLTNAFGDAIPALMAGNTVVIKPSEVTPLSSLMMVDCFREIGAPEDVLLVAPGFGETGAALIDHVDAIMFTGSTATGKKVMARAAETLTPVTLELGGKDPMVVLADADLERAANAAAHYSMQNSGQTCISVERVYVEEPVYDEFVGKVVEKVKALRQGSPGAPGTTDVGAITFPPQVDIIERHVNQAVEAGARVLTGGRATRDDGRYFFEPTVLVDVDHDMEAIREETFGPTLPIMKVRDAEEGIAKANDSQYGLNASVWTRDVTKGEALARRIEAGVVLVNDAQVNYAAMELPMGGWKGSGLGHRHGRGGIQKFCRQQAIVITRFSPLKKDLHMLPYNKTTTRLIDRMLRVLHGRGKRA